MKGRKRTVYVYLESEGTDVWRPVVAEHLDENRYRITSPDPDSADELWQFKSGAVVLCREQKLSGGNRLVAYDLAPEAD